MQANVSPPVTTGNATIATGYHPPSTMFTVNAAPYLGNGNGNGNNILWAANPAPNAAAAAYIPNYLTANAGPITFNIGNQLSNSMTVKGTIKSDDVEINGYSMRSVMESVMERLAILLPESGDLALPVLRQAYDDYLELEKDFYGTLSNNPDFQKLKRAADHYKLLKLLAKSDEK